MTTYKAATPELKIKRKDGSFAKVKIKSSDNAADFFYEIIDKELLEYQEMFMVVFLNQANNTIGYVKLSSGGLTQTMVDVRLLFKYAFSTIDHIPTSLIVCHNHPSGNPLPSEADKTLTRKLKAAGELLDIKVLDHIILYPTNTIRGYDYTSFSDDGLI
jgi:DNA repair protein RadC